MRAARLAVGKLLVPQAHSPHAGQETLPPGAGSAPPGGSHGSLNTGHGRKLRDLGGQTVTNTGPSVIAGNLGISPGNAIMGFPPGAVIPPGTIHAGDAVALQAQSDLATAYNTVAGEARTLTLTGQDLGGTHAHVGRLFF